MRDDIARRVAEVQFTPVRMREGYDMGEVDELLADGGITETRSRWSRLFGSKGR